jgi:membrane protease YdiL (CAAX protease family)
MVFIISGLSGFALVMGLADRLHVRKEQGYTKTEGTKPRFKKMYYNNKKCFKYLSLFGIWYVATLLIILRFLDEVMPPTTKLINIFRFFLAVGIIFSAWSGYKYFSKGRTHKAYYKHPDLKRDALKLVKSNTSLLAILFVLIFAVVALEPLIAYLDIPIFILALILTIKGVWYSMKRIDGIDLESDLYCWGMRIFGLVLFGISFLLFFFSFIFIFSLTLSGGTVVFGWIFPILSLCVFVLGVFCEFRTLRRYGYFVYVR